MGFSSRTRKAVLLCAIAVTLCAFPLTSSAHAMGRGHWFGHRGGVYYYPAYGWGWGGPFWSDYGYAWPYYYWNPKGTVKLESISKSDEVYINGSFAGEARKLKSINLDPGTYRISIKRNGKDILDQQVYVMRGKTVKLEVGDKSGKISFKDTAKGDKIYVNGAYEGVAGNLKSIRLNPGIYQVTVTNHGKDVFNQQVILPTKETVHLTVGDRS